VALFPKRALEQPGHPDLVLDYEYSHASTLRGDTWGRAK
jgi:hypothetical protein